MADLRRHITADDWDTVTTMLRLSVAIPIMLCHTLLSRRVETQISRKEEKSEAFVIRCQFAPGTSNFPWDLPKASELSNRWP
jgi:hypothetical protein